MAAAPQPLVPIFVLSQDQFINLVGNKDKFLPGSKFKYFVNNTGDVKSILFGDFWVGQE